MFNFIERLYLMQPKNLVYFDCLTKCKTRMYYDRVAKVKYHKRELNVAFVDVDNLKRINDEYGHVQGSKRLEEIIGQIKKIIGVEDICRIGGDEFIVIGTYDPIALDKIDGISYGVYLKEIYEALSSAVAKADRLMYINKKAKKQIIC